MNPKGQITFEALLILMVAITAAIFMGMLYLQTHDVTTATIIAKNEFLVLANSPQINETIKIEEVKIILGEKAILKKQEKK